MGRGEDEGWGGEKDPWEHQAVWVVAGRPPEAADPTSNGADGKEAREGAERSAREERPQISSQPRCQPEV